MTAYRGLFVKGTSATPSVGTTPLEARLAFAALLSENAPGVPRSGLMYQGTANVVTATATTAPWSYNISACNPVYQRTAGEGVYMWSLVGTTVANTIAAPASNSRWDLIYIMQNDVEKGDADNNPVIGVVNGVAAAAPTKPYASVPAGGYVIAEAQIFSGTTSTNNGTNTLTQVWRHTVPRGVPIPVRNVTERGEITPQIGTAVQRLDLGPTVVETWDGTVWNLRGARRHAEFTGPIVTSNAGAGVNFGQMTQDDTTGAAKVTFNNTFVQANPGNGIKILEDGLYFLQQIALPSANGGTVHNWATRSGSGSDTLISQQFSSYGSNASTGNAMFIAKAGDIVASGVTTSTTVTTGSRVKLTKIAD